MAVSSEMLNLKVQIIYRKKNLLNYIVWNVRGTIKYVMDYVIGSVKNNLLNFTPKHMVP